MRDANGKRATPVWRLLPGMPRWFRTLYRAARQNGLTRRRAIVGAASICRRVLVG